MNYIRSRKVKKPTVGKGRSAGVDFYVPQLSAEYLLDVAAINDNELQNDQIYIDKHAKIIVLAPGAHILMPSGIKCDLTSIDGAIYDEIRGIAYIAHNRSSIAKNKRLDVGADIVDEDYQGEMHFSLTNTSNQLIKLYSDEKILQFLAMPILYVEPKEYRDELYLRESERGTGGFGSTDNS